MTEKKLPAEPVEIPYKRWRHKEKGYTVNVIQVSHTLGKLGYLTMVRVECKGLPPASWTAATFLKTFEPVVKRKVPTRYQRITRKDRDST